MSSGSITSAFLNAAIERAARERDIPYQIAVSGRDTGTDAMAAVFAAVDAAASSVGFPIRNMHTISESGHTGDVLAAIHGLNGLLEELAAHDAGRGISRDDLRAEHPRLDRSAAIRHADSQRGQE